MSKIKLVLITEKKQNKTKQTASGSSFPNSGALQSAPAPSPGPSATRGLEPQRQRFRATCCHRPPKLLFIPALPIPGSPRAAVPSRQVPGITGIPAQAVLWPPANQGTSRSGSSIPARSLSLTHTHTPVAHRVPAVFPSSQLQQGGRSSPAPGKAALARSPRVPTPLSAPPLAPQAAARRGCSPRSCSPCLRQGGGTEGRREPRAQPKASRQAPGLWGVLSWKSFWAMFHYRASLL